MAAAVGNQYAAKDRLWRAALVRALDRRAAGTVGPGELDRLAGKLLDACGAGDLAALRELGDRLDGRPRQQIEASGPEGGPVVISWADS